MINLAHVMGDFSWLLLVVCIALQTDCITVCDICYMELQYNILHWQFVSVIILAVGMNCIVGLNGVQKSFKELMVCVDILQLHKVLTAIK